MLNLNRTQAWLSWHTERDVPAYYHKNLSYEDCKSQPLAFLYLVLQIMLSSHSRWQNKEIVGCDSVLASGTSSLPSVTRQWTRQLWNKAETGGDIRERREQWRREEDVKPGKPARLYSTFGPRAFSEPSPPPHLCNVINEKAFRRMEYLTGVQSMAQTRLTLPKPGRTLGELIGCHFQVKRTGQRFFFLL